MKQKTLLYGGEILITDSDLFPLTNEEKENYKLAYKYGRFEVYVYFKTNDV